MSRPRKAEPSFPLNWVHALGSNFLSETPTSFPKKLAQESLHRSSETPPTNGVPSNPCRFNSKTILKHNAILSFSFYEMPTCVWQGGISRKTFSHRSFVYCVFCNGFYCQSTSFNSEMNYQGASKKEEKGGREKGKGGGGGHTIKEKHGEFLLWLRGNKPD